MSHELEQRQDGTFSYVGARELPWHKLGKTYFDRQALTVTEVLDDLDVGEIISAPVQVPVNGQMVTYPSKRMNIRVRKNGEMNGIGIVSHTYPVVDERTAFGFLDQVIDSGEASVVSAGLLFEGKRAFCCFMLPEDTLVGGVDAVRMFAMIHISHDGSTPIFGAITPIRTVCQNTVVMGLQAAARIWSVRHTPNMQLQVAEARNALDITYKYADAWNKAAEELMAVKVNNQKFDEIITELFAPNEPSPSKVAVSNWGKKRDDLFTLFSEADTQVAAGIGGTAWGAFNAIIEWQDWARPVRGADDTMAAQFQRSLTESSDKKDEIRQAVRQLVGVA
jgi:phage/plasmid-like protein (TIGR03299 family)